MLGHPWTVLPILTHETRFPGQPHQAATHGWALPADDTVADAPLHAFVNDGRWLVQCECQSAELAHQGDPRFFCAGCGNAAHDGKWRPVVWPDAKAEIERLLKARPYRQAQNWRPGMPVEHLAAANREHGVVA